MLESISYGEGEGTGSVRPSVKSKEPNGRGEWEIAKKRGES